ncbi:MAG: glycosyltransferase [PVC group bacterium]
MNSEIPKVSICIPTYNQGRFLGECLQSALNQTYRDIEIIVSVNHCTDNTDEVLGQFSDPRLRIVRPGQFLPVKDNFTFCISRSRGEYFCYVCSDDLFLPEFIESQASFLDRYPSVAFVYCAVERIDEAGKTIRLEKSINHSWVRKGSQELKRYIDGMKCVGDACLVRRAAYEAVGGIDTELFVDWELCLRLLQYGDVAYNERVLMKYRDWVDEYRAGARRWEFFLALISFYETYQPKILQLYPGWLKLFKKARRKKALSFITSSITFNPGPRREIKEQIFRLSNSWMVKVKLFLVTIGLGFIWRGKKRAIARLRYKVKPVFYPRSIKKL